MIVIIKNYKVCLTESDSVLLRKNLFSLLKSLKFNDRKISVVERQVRHGSFQLYDHGTVVVDLSRLKSILEGLLRLSFVKSKV